MRLLRGESGAQRLGWSIAGAGDLDGDGYSDLLATSLRPGSTDVAVEARVYRGSADGLLGTAAVVIEAGTNSDTEGARVAGIGDVNDDGRPDFAVGLPNESNDVPGEVCVYLGSDGPLAAPVLLRGASGQSFGGTVAGAGDVNGSTSAKVGQFLMGIDMR